MITHLILDTNIIIRFPEVLSFRKENIKITVPDVVLEQLMNSKYTGTKRLLKLIESAQSIGNIIITNTTSPKARLASSILVDFTDFSIAGYAMFLKEQGNENVIIATEDKKFAAFCITNNIKTFGLSDVIDFFNTSQLTEEFNKTSEKEGKGNEKTEVTGSGGNRGNGGANDNVVIKEEDENQPPTNRLQNQRLIAETRTYKKQMRASIFLNILSASFILFFIYLIYTQLGKVGEKLTVPLIIFALVSCGFGLFELRTKNPILYGLIEIGIGVMAIIAMFSPTFDISFIELNLDFYLKIAAGLYIIVRGLDNLSKGTSEKGIVRIIKRMLNIDN